MHQFHITEAVAEIVSCLSVLDLHYFLIHTLKLDKPCLVHGSLHAGMLGTFPMKGNCNACFSFCARRKFGIEPDTGMVNRGYTEVWSNTKIYKSCTTFIICAVTGDIHQRSVLSVHY